MFFALWTKPYYGVSHLKQPSRRYQFTVHENPSGTAYGYMLDNKSGKAFTAVKEIYAINVKAVKEALEGWAKELDLLKS